MTADSADNQDKGDMARLGAGQEAALNDLIQRHGEKLCHYLIRALQNEEDAADSRKRRSSGFTGTRRNLIRGRNSPPGSTPSPPTWLKTATATARDIRKPPWTPRIQKPAAAWRSRRPIPGRSRAKLYN